MSANCRELEKFARDIERLNSQQKEEFLQSCCKELAARLLSKVAKRTPSSTGVLRRGWNASPIHHFGNTYQVDITNVVEYASYVEYGHRTKNHTGWVPGKFMLTISEEEIKQSTPKILQQKLNKYIRDVLR